MIGHAKISGEVCRGVITVHEQETSASLKAKIHWLGGSIAFIRKLCKTSVALLTFEGRHVPRFVHYNRVVTPVREYKRTIPACYRCGTVGHRVELCSHPNDHAAAIVVKLWVPLRRGWHHTNASHRAWCAASDTSPDPRHAKQDFAACSSRAGIMAATAPRSSGQRPKTSDVTPEGRHPELPTKPQEPCCRTHQ
ncbi:hypothetical protein HPB52_024549 [Rhipicephalus sanguineus]|uniref:CCHC-type domain-containing protein n=1 Tax=Rhipicephalus sanguineus TaxID=34632 RepID=A0A9D4TE78_RHISA|nr:hypothetical protein HPB52_024549 [Rhipicephalus sanguineus]